ncbi:hypothetical protein MJO29_005119 [Puccinia striiformis f. sp. tritici]|nr:hypothetical protein MJO29_005119 [Puccinia striiformis f. sp. tritici]
MSDLEYQDIAKQAISRLHQRVAQHGSQTFHGNEPPCDELSQFENETLYNLGRIVLPKLKKNLKLLSIALDPSTPQGDGILVTINAVIAILTDIDTILGELDDLIKMIGHSPNSGPRPPGEDSKVRHFTFFQARQTESKVKGLLTGTFSDVLGACGKLLGDLGLSSSSVDKSSVILVWKTLDRQVTLTIGKIDVLSRWLGKSLSDAAREEWQRSIEEIDIHLNGLLDLLKPGCQECDGGYEIESDDEFLVMPKPPYLKLVQAGIAILKLCRMYFTKLSRSTNLLIFDGPSTRMNANQLKLLLKVTSTNEFFVGEFIDTIEEPESDCETVECMVMQLIGGFVRMSRVLSEYYDSLLPEKRPRVDREEVAEARHWLDSWNSTFLLATANAIGSPVCKWSWQELAEGKYLFDDDDDDLNPDGGWEARWELANGKPDQKR